MTLEEKITNYFTKKKEVIAVYLFGSYAAGDDAQKSRAHDIDIGILLRRDSHGVVNKEKRIEYCVELGRILRKDIHPVILNFAGEELMRQIFLKGRCLLIKDSIALARFKMFMFSQIAEFGYYRNQLQSGFIAKAMED